MSNKLKVGDRVVLTKQARHCHGKLVGVVTEFVRDGMYDGVRCRICYIEVEGVENPVCIYDIHAEKVEEAKANKEVGW